jgi:hypothetical protein
MYAGASARVLNGDDLQALGVSPYTNWRNVGANLGAANIANDIGASAVGTSEYVWMFGTGTNGEGFKLFRWRESSSDWLQINGGGVRIDMQGGTPWVVTNAGLAKQVLGTPEAPNGTGWGNRGKCGNGFVDIGAGGGVVWALGGTVDANGNYDLFRYNGTGANKTDCSDWLALTNHTGDGVRLDVGPDGSPWVVTNNGELWHREGVSGNTPLGSTWAKHAPAGNAQDVSVGPDSLGKYGVVWMVGPNERIYLLNVQTGRDISTPADGDFSDPGDTPERNQWYQVSNGGRADFISVGRFGMPWVIGTDKSVARRRP